MIETWFRQELTKPVKVQYLDGNVFSQDNNGNTIIVEVEKNGEPFNLTGAVSASVVRADGATLAVSGSVFGNQASVTLPEAAYLVPGVLSIVIKVTTGSATSTVCAVVANVYRSSTDIPVDPGTIIPSISDLIAQIEAAIATIPPDYEELVEGVDIATGMKALNLTFSAGYINPSTLEIVTTSTGNHQISQAVHIPAMSLLYVPKISKSNSTTLLCECNSSGTPTFATLRGPTTANSDGSYIIVPVVNESYFIFAGNTTMTDYMKYYVKTFDEDMVFDGNNYAKWCPNPAELQYAEGPIIDSGTSTGTMYEHTSSFLLMKGMTLEFWDAGSASNVALSKYNNQNYTIISSLIHSTGGIGHQEYTATETMYVRLSARVRPPTDGYGTVVPTDKFYGWRIYYKPFHVKKYENSPIYGKKLTVMGDSLIHGNSLGPGVTWITGLGIKYGMTFTNLGINGNTVAEQSAETSNAAMVNRISSVPSDTDIFVLLGGANDKRLNVPIGDIDSTDKTTFCGALNTIVSSLRTRCPKVRILFMTTYNRYSSRNNQGFGDEDYANAMIEAAKNNLVPCFDNFHCSGVNFLDDNMISWMDESRNRQKSESGTTVYDDPTHHFSVEGYEWITPIYEAYLSAGTATPILPQEDAEQCAFIEELLANAPSVVTVTGSNQYVTPYGKYVTVNGVVYFKIMFKNNSNVTSGTGSTAVANLPAPSGSPIFFEVGRSMFAIGSRLIYDSVWRLQGTRKSGDYSLVYGSYVPA